MPRDGCFIGTVEGVQGLEATARHARSLRCFLTVQYFSGRCIIILRFDFGLRRTPFVASAQSISIALYHSNTTCLSNGQADVSYTSSPGAGCQTVNLYPDGKYKAAGAFSAKVISISPDVVLRLFDVTGCSDSTPDEAKGDGSLGCVAGAASGAGWLSFRVDTV